MHLITESWKRHKYDELEVVVNVCAREGNETPLSTCIEILVEKYSSQGPLGSTIKIPADRIA